MGRLRRALRAWRRALEWAVLEPTDQPMVYTVRVRRWHPGLWWRVAAGLWRASVLTVCCGRCRVSVGGGPR